MVCPKAQNFCHISCSPIVMWVESLDLNLGVGWLHVECCEFLFRCAILAEGECHWTRSALTDKNSFTADFLISWCESSFGDLWGLVWVWGGCMWNIVERPQKKKGQVYRLTMPVGWQFRTEWNRRSDEARTLWIALGFGPVMRRSGKARWGKGNRFHCAILVPRLNDA